MIDTNAIKARLGSISPSAMEKLPLVVVRLLADLSVLVEEHETLRQMTTEQLHARRGEHDK